MGNQPQQYRWKPVGWRGMCECGGRLIEYEVDPPRRVYFSKVAVCDGPACRVMTTKDGRLTGRNLILVA